MVCDSTSSRRHRTYGTTCFPRKQTIEFVQFTLSDVINYQYEELACFQASFRHHQTPKHKEYIKECLIHHGVYFKGLKAIKCNVS